MLHGDEGTRGERLRERIRAGELTGPTAGFAPGLLQTNLVILPRAQASDFRNYCRANPHALPLLEVTDPGCPTPRRLAPTADLRVDLPRYRLYRHGDVVDEPTDIVRLWHHDLVAFLLGCSFTFDAVLEAHGIPVRHLRLGTNVPMYVTDRRTIPAGAFAGPLVVSMRPIAAKRTHQAVALTRSVRLRPLGATRPASETAPFDATASIAHGEPIHVGDPAVLGIADLDRPSYGDPVPIEAGEVPMFWACGVTAQAAGRACRIPWMITHAPGHMFITDRSVETAPHPGALKARLNDLTAG